ncbi:hypothetical protein MHB77_17955 [Paenibacillus sp. FSL K6-3166]
MAKEVGRTGLSDSAAWSAYPYGTAWTLGAHLLSAGSARLPQLL